MRAALFDMDGTLVRVNTATLYLKWRLSRGEATWRQAVRAAGWIAQYSLGVVDATRVTARALRSLEGLEEARFESECRLWFDERVRSHVTDAARAEVDRMKREGRACAILTATTPYASMPLAEDLGIEHVLCTRLEVVDGRFTGAWQEPLCYGHGKVVVAERWARELGVDLAQSAFYSDSISDLPMLARVGDPRVVNPDPRLRIRAALEGWPVVRWD